MGKVERKKLKVERTETQRRAFLAAKARFAICGNAAQTAGD
jgi:hypothetical protein